MYEHPFSLDVIEVASPCHVDWEQMTGTQQVRHCSSCQKNVYNLTEMTRDEAVKLILETEGGACVRFYRREDGTVLTADCPLGWRAAAQRKVSRWVAAGAAACLTLVTAVNSWGKTSTSANQVAVQGPLDRLTRWLHVQSIPANPPPNPMMMAQGGCPAPPVWVRPIPPVPPVPQSVAVEDKGE